MSNNISIINYGMGNLHSVKRKIDKLKANSVITSNPKEILKSDKIILVGVGHFKMAMKNLSQLSLIDSLNEAVLIKKIPVLGICLGMQLMAKKSEEGDVEGLGWIDADIKKIKVEDPIKFKVPHMGWNTVKVIKDSKLMEGISNSSEFYFVHSYFCEANDHSLILNETTYSSIFTSAIEKNNIFGVQYHPEKSHDIGNRVLLNFIKI